MKKLLILLCLLILIPAGNAYADAAIGGAYEGDVYRNAWLDISFTPVKKFEFRSGVNLGAVSLNKTDAETVSRQDARDFNEAVAFEYYNGQSNSVTLKVINPAQEQTRLGIVANADDYLAKCIERDKARASELVVGEPYDAVLAGQAYKAYLQELPSASLKIRTYVREQDGLLVVIVIRASQDTDNMLALFESCFGNYDDGAAQVKPQMDMGEYFSGGYRNAWLELDFNVQTSMKTKGRFFDPKQRPQEYWFSDTGEHLERIQVDGDVSEIRAFAYDMTKPRVSVLDVRVVNMGEQILNREYVKSAEEYIAFRQMVEPESLGGKIDYSATKTLTLGSKQFLSYEYRVPVGGFYVRVYVRQVDNWLLVIEMSTVAKEKEMKEAQEIFALFEKGFSKYK